MFSSLGRNIGWSRVVSIDYKVLLSEVTVHFEKQKGHGVWLVGK